MLKAVRTVVTLFALSLILFGQGCALRSTVEQDHCNTTVAEENLRAVLTLEASTVLDQLRSGGLDTKAYAHLLACVWYGADVQMLMLTRDELLNYAGALNTRTDIAEYVFRENLTRGSVTFENLKAALDARFGTDY
ncbi:MAG: hypothetical protein Q8Q20_04340 [bacterium]|nr:hypothetical protein [bacterium]